MYSLPVLSKSFDESMQNKVTPTLYPVLQTSMTISVYMTVVIAVYAFFCIRPKDQENDEPNSTEHLSMKTVYFTIMFVITFSTLFNISRWFELRVVENTVSGTVC